MMRVCIVLFLSLLFNYRAIGQIVVDLSKSNISSETIDVNIKPEIEIRNMLPNGNFKYFISIEMKEEEIAPFSSGTLADVTCNQEENTDAYIKAKNKLLDAKDELGLPPLIKKLQTEIDKLNSKYEVCKEEGKLLIRSTTNTKDLQFPIRNNQTIKVNIRRDYKTDAGKDTSKNWQFTFVTPSKSPWHVMYGFTFIPNSMNPVRNYFSKADTSGKSFTITKLNNQRNDFLENISPTLMFQYAPMKKYSWKENSLKSIFSNNFYQIGFTGGLSLNFANETSAVNVMAGPSIVIADNMSLSGGVVLTRKNVLKGQYKEGDVVKENLTFDQLHEKKYMGEWFISLAIRFDSNPFKKEENKK